MPNYWKIDVLQCINLRDDGVIITATAKEANKEGENVSWAVKYCENKTTSLPSLTYITTMYISRDRLRGARKRNINSPQWTSPAVEPMPPQRSRRHPTAHLHAVFRTRLRPSSRGTSRFNSNPENHITHHCLPNTRPLNIPGISIIQLPSPPKPPRRQAGILELIFSSPNIEPTDTSTRHIVLYP